MARLTKKQKVNTAKVEAKTYTLSEASALIKEISNTNFDPSVDLAVRLNVDPRKANQMVRGVVTLPHGTGKDVKVLALVTPDKEAEATAAGADFVGMDDLAEKFKKEEIDVDVVISSQAAMKVVGQLGQVLGPKGLMPNPKTGTVTEKVGEAINNAKSGQVRFRTDKNGILHGCIGKVSFSSNQI